jgi:putative redox protein
MVSMMTLTLDWQGDLKFKNGPGSPAIELHSSTPGVVSPMHALGYAVMACMAMDVVHVLQKGRHDLKALSLKFEGERAADHPKRFTAMRLQFDITGRIDGQAVDRAIDLSRTKYCSVWNTIRPDVDLRTSCVIHD